MHKQAGKQKRGEETHKWANRVLFSTYVHVQKMLHVVKDDCGAQRGSCGGIEGKEEARGAIWMVKRKEGPKKTNGGTKQNENGQVQICLTRRFEEQKNQAQNERKQTSRKIINRQKKQQAAE